MQRAEVAEGAAVEAVDVFERGTAAVHGICENVSENGGWVIDDVGVLWIDPKGMDHRDQPKVLWDRMPKFATTIPDDFTKFRVKAEDGALTWQGG